MTSQTLTAFSSDALPVITHHDHPVMTTDLLAAMYGTDSKNIRKNFERNLDRFVSGKHYFKLDGHELSSFREVFNDLYTPERRSQTADQGVYSDLYFDNFDIQISAKTRSALLWTERGAARHAKMLDTDQAWDVFEQLEDAYFDRREGDNLENLGITSKEYNEKDDALLKTLVDYGKIKDDTLCQVAAQRIVRLCRQLGYSLPEGLTAKQLDLGI